MQLVDTDHLPNGLQQKELHEKRKRFQLARLITLSEDMLNHAKTGDWEKVEELELMRRVELDECFAMQNESPSLLISQALATLVHINEQLVYLVKQARDRVSTEHGKHYQSHKIASTYQQVLE